MLVSLLFVPKVLFDIILSRKKSKKFKDSERTDSYYKSLQGIDQKYLYTQLYHFKTKLGLKNAKAETIERLRTSQRKTESKVIMGNVNYSILENSKYAEMFKF